MCCGLSALEWFYTLWMDGLFVSGSQVFRMTKTVFRPNQTLQRLAQGCVVVWETHLGEYHRLVHELRLESAQFLALSLGATTIFSVNNNRADYLSSWHGVVWSTKRHGRNSKQFCGCGLLMLVIFLACRRVSVSPWQRTCNVKWETWKKGIIAPWGNHYLHG